MFLGAGASRPLGLLTTPEFWEWFRYSSGLDTGLLSAIAAAVEPSEEIGRKTDIEAVLDMLEKLNEAGQLRNKILEHHYPAVAVPTVLSEFEAKFEEVSEKIKDMVFEHYSEINEIKASRLYYPLLKLAESRPLPVFTTNYDLAIEETYDECTDFYPTADDKRSFIFIDSFDRTKLKPEWSSLAYEHYRPTGVDVIFFKLHGSVDWVRTVGGAIQRVDIPQRQLGGAPRIIAYPSRLKREIHEEPFRTNYDYLLACLLHAKVCAVIGFSFRDQEIVEELRQAMQLNKGLELMIIDPNAEAIEFHLWNKLGFKPKAQFIPEALTLENAQSIADTIAAMIKR